MLRRLSPLIRNDPRTRQRNSGIPSRSPRFRALVQNLFSFPLHLLTIPQPIPHHTKLKTECHLQIDPPIRSRLRKGPGGKSIRKAEKRRAQVAYRSIQVHVVKDVPRRHRKRQGVAMIRKIAVRSSGAASAKAAALSRRSAGPAPERAAGAWAATDARVCRFRFFSKTKRLAQPEIQSKFSRSGQKIDRHDFLTGPGK